MDLIDLARRIDTEYQAGRYGLGWRLLASPASCLTSGRIAFVGLNPGGAVADPDHAILAPESGSAYVTESWAGYSAGASPLQRQVRSLFAALDIEPEKVIAGNLVPFRSPDWQSLPNRSRAISFGKALWREILRETNADLVVTMGGIAFDAMADVLDVADVQESSSGWGAVKLRKAERRGLKLVGLPHLSRYGLVLRPASQAPLRSVFGEHWQRI